MSANQNNETIKQVVWASVARSSFQGHIREYWVRFPTRTILGQCAYFYAWAKLIIHL